MRRLFILLASLVLGPILLLMMMIIFFGQTWNAEIEMADGESIVEIKQSGYDIRIEIGPRNEIDRDVIIIEDCIYDFWLSLPKSGNKDIYILDCGQLVQQVHSNRYNIHVIKEYMMDSETYSVEWMDPDINRTRDTYHIDPSRIIEKVVTD